MGLVFDFWDFGNWLLRSSKIIWVFAVILLHLYLLYHWISLLEGGIIVELMKGYFGVSKTFLMIAVIVCDRLVLELVLYSY
jgi:hypothetical protein